MTMTSLNNLPEIITSDSNMRALDRVLKLEVMDNKKAKDSHGNIDTRLFTGKQNLHCKMDIQTNLWSFQYDNNGLLPGALQGRFTSFSKAYDFAKDYFERRNIRIASVED